MTRRTSILAWMTVVSLSLVLMGCPKKKPDTTADQAPMSPSSGTDAPAERVTGTTSPSISDQQADPLSEDLQAVNEYVSQQGLLGDVYFDFDQYELKAEAIERLAKNAAFLKENPEFVLTIEGHCDERGTNEYNIALGDRRANATKSYLSSLGVETDRLRTISKGEEQPQCMDAGESCWWRNRRAHFMITGRS